ncbi:MAG TPA: hypothetical protein VEC17_00440 [Candidatus Binatia bacterium]|nr:hypothetical protein [Candidatus Binatia bacterium]
MSRIEIGHSSDPRRDAAEEMARRAKFNEHKADPEKAGISNQIEINDLPKKRDYSAELVSALEEIQDEPLLYEALTSLPEEKLSALEAYFGIKGAFLADLKTADNLSNITRLIRILGETNDDQEIRKISLELVKATQ